MHIQTTYNSISRTVWTEMVRKAPTGNWFQTPEAYEFYAEQIFEINLVLGNNHIVRLDI